MTPQGAKERRQPHGKTGYPLSAARVGTSASSCGAAVGRLAPRTDLSMPVRRAFACRPQNSVLPEGRGPHLDQVLVEDCLRPVIHCSSITAPSAYTNPVWARGEHLNVTRALAGPRAPNKPV